MKWTNYAAAVVLGLVLVSAFVAGCKNHNNDNAEHADHSTEVRIEQGHPAR